MLTDELFLSPGFSQLCYNATECTGEGVQATSARKCCVETDRGKSYSDESGDCIVRECIGNNFTRAPFIKF